MWWAERGHISKAIGPFLRKRMVETGTYMNVAARQVVEGKGGRSVGQGFLKWLMTIARPTNRP
jgi:hypothetical protein